MAVKGLIPILRECGMNLWVLLRVAVMAVAVAAVTITTIITAILMYSAKIQFLDFQI
jgi:hypothetical protein